MANADKCYLRIPHKNYLADLTVDEDGKISAAALKRAADQEFQNYKEIENRINNPECVPSGSCGCVNFHSKSSIFTDTTDTIAINESKIGGQNNVLRNVGGFGVDTVTGRVTPPSRGLYTYTGMIEMSQNSGSDTPQLDFSVNVTSTGDPSATISFFPPVLPAITASFRLTVAGQCFFETTDFWTVGVGSYADAGSREFRIGGGEGLFLSITKVCGCDDAV